MAKVELFSDGWYEHYCPGCESIHLIAVGSPFPNGQSWTFNQDFDKPTFNPSINIIGRCHYFIREGMIEYCSDSQHALAGQTVPLPEL